MRLSGLAQEPRQLGDVHRNQLRLIFCEHLCGRSPSEKCLREGVTLVCRLPMPSRRLGDPLVRRGLAREWCRVWPARGDHLGQRLCDSTSPPQRNPVVLRGLIRTFCRDCSARLVTLVGGLAIPLQRLGIVLWYAAPHVVNEPQNFLGFEVAFVG